MKLFLKATKNGISKIDDKQLEQLLALPKISKIAFCMHFANKVVHWYENDYRNNCNLYSMYMTIKTSYLQELLTDFEIAKNYNCGFCDDIDKTGDPLFIVNLPGLQQFSIHQPISKKSNNIDIGIVEQFQYDDSWRNHLLVSQQSTNILQAQNKKLSPEKKKLEIIKLSIQSKTVLEQITDIENKYNIKAIDIIKYRNTILELQSQLKDTITELNYIGANKKEFEYFYSLVNEKTLSELKYMQMKEEQQDLDLTLLKEAADPITLNPKSSHYEENLLNYTNVINFMRNPDISTLSPEDLEDFTDFLEGNEPTPEAYSDFLIGDIDFPQIFIEKYSERNKKKLQLVNEILKDKLATVGIQSSDILTEIAENSNNSIISEDLKSQKIDKIIDITTELENSSKSKITTTNAKYLLYYLKFSVESNIQIPEELQEQTSSEGLEKLLAIANALNLNPLDLDDIEKTLNNQFKTSSKKTILDFKDESLDEILGIEKLATDEKRAHRIILNLKFIKQQHEEEYEKLIINYPNIDSLLDEKTFEEEIFDTASEYEKEIRISNTQNPIISYIKKDILSIPEIPEETTIAMKKILMDQIRSNDLKDSELNNIKLEAESSLANVFSPKQLKTLRRIAAVKLAISETKFSDEQKLYMTETLKDLVATQYDINNSIFDNLNFESKPETELSKWSKYLEKLEKGVNKDKLEEAANIFTELEKAREGEAK